jgi:hypothetical protein
MYGFLEVFKDSSLFKAVSPQSIKLLFMRTADLEVSEMGEARRGRRSGGRGYNVTLTFETCWVQHHNLTKIRLDDFNGNSISCIVRD